MADTVVDLGAGAPSMSMNEFMFGQKFPGPVYKEGQSMGDPYYMGEEYSFELEDPRRFDPYEDSGMFAEPLTEEKLETFDEEGRQRPRYPNFQGSFKNAPEMYLGEGGIADLPPDFGTTEGEIDDFDMMTLGKEPTDRGISGLLMYEGLAPPQYPMRPIQKQKFGKKRGFQFGQMVQLNDRDGAVGGKLLKQAGIQASANQVLETLDPKVVDQMSRILGRDIG